MRRSPVMKPLWLRLVVAVERDNNDCWLWQKKVDRYGRGWVWARGKYRRAYRVAYEEFVGAIPAGLEIDHLCYVPACINPAHLEPVTHAENMRRRGARTVHCINGHEFDAANTYRDPADGSRRCRRCNRDAVARLKARRTLAATGSDR